MQGDALKRWRSAERARLIAAREALGRETLEAFRGRIDRHLEKDFPNLRGECSRSAGRFEASTTRGISRERCASAAR
jgi:hypothetical protein